MMQRKKMCVPAPGISPVLKHWKPKAAALLLAVCLAFPLGGCGGFENQPEPLSSAPSSSAASSRPASSQTESSEPSSEPASSDSADSSEYPSSSDPLPSSSSGSLSSIVSSVTSTNQASKNPSSGAPSSQPASSQAPSSAPPPSSEPSSEPPPSSSAPQKPSKPADTSGEMKAVWLSYLEFQQFKGSDRAAFTRRISAIFDTIAAKGLNTVFVQVRPYGDSFYESEYYPWSKCISGTVDVGVDYDPLQITIDAARARGLSVHAWINPYRTMTSKEFDQVSDSWMTKQWYNSADRGSYMIQAGDQWWLQPGNPEVQTLIANGVNEIMSRYDVDGIHMDDYFYNASPLSYGDSKAQAKQNTTDLVQLLYTVVKAYGQDKLFGVSPLGSYRENADLPASDTGDHSTDLALWCTQPGYIDYVMPQIYWEYDHATQPFLMTLQKWEDLVDTSVVDLYIGLAPYRLTAQTIYDQIADIEADPFARGYCLFRYDHIVNLALS